MVANRQSGATHSHALPCLMSVNLPLLIDNCAHMINLRMTCICVCIAVCSLHHIYIIINPFNKVVLRVRILYSISLAYLYL